MSQRRIGSAVAAVPRLQVKYLNFWIILHHFSHFSAILPHFCGTTLCTLQLQSIRRLPAPVHHPITTVARLSKTRWAGICSLWWMPGKVLDNFWDIKFERLLKNFAYENPPNIFEINLIAVKKKNRKKSFNFKIERFLAYWYRIPRAKK